MADPKFIITNTRGILKLMPKELKGVIASILKGVNEELLFGSDRAPKKVSKYEIKMGKDNYEFVSKRVPGKESVVSGKKTLDVVFEGFPFRFQVTGKTKGAADASTTQKQELASLWIIRRALKGNTIFKTIEDIKQDKMLPELVGYWPEVLENKVWINGLLAQQAAVLREFSGDKFDEFNRDGGFMKFITNLIKDYGISKKDVWNPADIWIMNNEGLVLREIRDATDGRVDTIENLNSVMRKLFAERRLIGISLKQISNKQAFWEEVNIKKFSKADTNYVYDLTKIQNFLNIKGGKVQNAATSVVIENSGNVFIFDIRQDSKGFSNLKFEPKEKRFSKARLGKVPLNKFALLLKENQINFENKHYKYPKTLEEFNRNWNKYMLMWNTLNTKRTPKIDFQISNVDDFKASFIFQFENDAGVAMSKLMQIDFLHSLYEKSDHIRDKVLTQMLFLSMKKGKGFGPFGKLK